MLERSASGFQGCLGLLFLLVYLYSDYAAFYFALL